MAIVNEDVRQKIKEGIEHVKIHMETAQSGPIGRLLFPSIQSGFTQVKMAAMLGNVELRSRAENILKHHGLMQPTQQLPKSTQGNMDTCLLAKSTGIPGSYDGILNLTFLQAWERILLLEFVQRFDMGEYPDLILPPAQNNRVHSTKSD